MSKAAVHNLRIVFLILAILMGLALHSQVDSNRHADCEECLEVSLLG